MPRTLVPYVQAFVEHFPVVSLVGPRRTGKTALAFDALPGSRLLDGERPDLREELRRDPMGLLQAADRTVLRGAHRIPQLLPALGRLLAAGGKGRFLLLAERPLVGEGEDLRGLHSRLWSLPLALDEHSTLGMTLDEVLWTGGFPGLLEGRMPASVWFSELVGEFLDRDLRSMVDVVDLEGFLGFLRAVAGQTGQGLNVSALAKESGIAHGTAKSWLAALEAALWVLPAPAFQHPEKKRLVTSPRLHLVDTGLACWLLGLESPKALAAHPLRGWLFQSFVWTELLKGRLHRGAPPGLAHYRDRKGASVDIVHTARDGTTLVQVVLVPRASGPTLRTLNRLGAWLEARDPSPVRRLLVHAGDQRLDYRGVELVPWREVVGVLG